MDPDLCSGSTLANLVEPAVFSALFLPFPKVVSTSMSVWGLIPDVVGDGVSDQVGIMAAICEAKGAAFDGADCVGDLNDATVFVSEPPLHP